MPQPSTCSPETDTRKSTFRLWKVNPGKQPRNRAGNSPRSRVGSEANIYAESTTKNTKTRRWVRSEANIYAESTTKNTKTRRWVGSEASIYAESTTKNTKTRRWVGSEGNREERKGRQGETAYRRQHAAFGHSSFGFVSGLGLVA